MNPERDQIIIDDRGGGQHSTVDHHQKASKAAHFSRKSAAPRLHRRLEKILPIEFFLNASVAEGLRILSRPGPPFALEIVI